MKQRILGLDTGTNSLGWAVVDRYDDNHYELVDCGVRIFQEGVKVEKGVESSKAAERTGHRALRRQYFRRRLRKIEVLKVLVRYNLCPPLSEEDLRLWHNSKVYPAKDEFMQWQRTDDKMDYNPYHCRYVCLYERLDMERQQDRYTLGRAMYHLAQRRGFLSNRLDESDENKEVGAVKKGISELSEDMEQKGCRYLGEYFYLLYKEQGNAVRIRTRYTDREQHYRTEFDAICEKQHLSAELRAELERALYFQRPLKSQRRSVGKCTFERNKPRVSDSHPAYEEFRMLSFLNNVRVQKHDMFDTGLRPFNDTELAKIEKLFYRKSKQNFDFEELARTIAGKGQYETKDENTGKLYTFNYRMSQGVSGCPTTAQLRDIFGIDWQAGIAEVYTQNKHHDGTFKTVEEMADDVWNVLFFFDSKEKLQEFAKNKLQLDEERAKKFSEIRLSRNYASLSLKSIRRILPFLRMGIQYNHAVFMANIPKLVGREVWENDAERTRIMDKVSAIASANHDSKDKTQPSKDVEIKEWLHREYGVEKKVLEKLYHPSMIETYPDPTPNKDGVILLGSPRTDAVRNPMAMRSLHQLRHVVNSLIYKGIIDHSTIVHIEYARELNNANQRAALNAWQREQKNKRKGYANEIRKLGFAPTDTDILKYQLWEEQERHCLYTGAEIAVEDFLGANPKYDIEHTIPRSVGGDSTQENLTLCDSRYNREVKKARIPYQLPEMDYDGILERIEKWKDKADDLSRKIDKLSHGRGTDKDANDRRIQKKNRLKLERDYWLGKYGRFRMKEVTEGFARRQGAGIGLISKYAALYLKSYFKDIEHPERRQIYSIKGITTSEYRKMWGIQDVYEKKSRDSHTHHCIDALVIACIGKREYDTSAHYYRQLEEWEHGMAGKPQFPKPWPTFTEDVAAMTNEILVVHDTPDNMPKKASRRVEVKGHGKVVAKGDCARGSLHNDTYYGAIKRDGEIRYVVRKELSMLKETDIKDIVDETVREKIRAAVQEREFKEALAEPIYMNKEKGILIKKVRCYATKITDPLHIRKQRDLSTRDYKQQFHVTNDMNYCMAIYEGEVKGKVKRIFQLVNMLKAATILNTKQDEKLVPTVYKGLNLKYVIRKGTQLLMLEQGENRNSVLADKHTRLFHVTQMKKDGRLILCHSSEARQETEIKKYRNANPFVESDDVRPTMIISLNKFDFLVEGYDFELTALGEIIFKQ